MAAVQGDAWALQFASCELKNDPEIVMAAVQQKGRWALQHASDEFWDDPEVLMAVVQQDREALKLVSDDLKKLHKNSCTQKYARFMARKDIRNLHMLNKKHRADMAWLFAKN